MSRFNDHQTKLFRTLSSAASGQEHDVLFDFGDGTFNLLGVINGTENSDTINGTSGVDTINGLGGRDVLSGLDGNDILNGGNDNDVLLGGDGLFSDVLDGGAGADYMAGGPGSDQYIVDNSSDVIFEPNTPGFDFVFITGNLSFYSLEGADIERTEILNPTSNTAIRGSDDQEIILGNEGNNAIAALAGQDFVNGRGGDDSIYGGDNDDTLATGFGADTLFAENGDDLIIIGDYDDNLLFRSTQNPFASTDQKTISGGAGKDQFGFTFGFGVTTILDFEDNEDILLNFNVFTGFDTPGSLTEEAFHRGASATSNKHRIIYDRAHGDVYYDEDGVGGVDQVLLAHFTNKPQNLSHTNFDIVPV